MMWRAEARELGEVRFRIGREDGMLVAEWPGVARLRTDRAGHDVRFETEPTSPAMVVQKIRHVVHALLRHLRGELTLHASAVANDRGALAFIGDSGAGKSTLASALCQRTHGLLSDDLLFVEGIDALPSEAIPHLDAKAHEGLEKRPISRWDERQPLLAIVHLAYGADHALLPMQGASAASVLVRSMVRFVVDEDDAARRDMDRLQELVSRVPILELRRQRGFDHLLSTLRLIEEKWGVG
jgi:serine kinase of HPr protein (carbohydrate metabolism regulator)